MGEGQEMVRRHMEPREVDAPRSLGCAWSEMRYRQERARLLGEAADRIELGAYVGYAYVSVDHAEAARRAAVSTWEFVTSVMGGV